MELERRVLSAQQNRSEIDDLLRDYLPLIKKEVQALASGSPDFDDLLSIGMLAFVTSVQRFDAERGSFVTFAKVNIRNRLIDELRRSKNNVIPVSFQADDGDSTSQVLDNSVSLGAYAREQERATLAEEIAILSDELKLFGIDFGELPAICPKQERSRTQCLELARSVVKDPDLKAAFVQSKKLPQAALAQRHGISVKTIEKHRKYILTLVVLSLGDYPGICTFLPQYEEVR